MDIDSHVRACGIDEDAYAELNYFVKVLDSNGDLVGCGGATVKGPVAYIRILGVVESKRRQGIGSMILRDIVAAHRGHAIRLLPRPDRVPYYLKRGFVVADQGERGADDYSRSAKWDGHVLMQYSPPD